MVTPLPSRLPGAALVRAWLYLTSATLRRAQGLAFWELALVHRLVWFGS